jgi:Xaa-Pro aminopeptidase
MPLDTSKAVTRKPRDGDVSTNLLEFMLKDWSPKVRRPPKVLPNAAGFRDRRARLSQQFPAELLVIPTGHRKIRANDTYYTFRPGTDFYYLTGSCAADGVLVLLPNGTTHQHVLFVEPNAGKTDATFFTDMDKGELWEGPRFNVSESEIRHAITCKPLTELKSTLDTVLVGPSARMRVLRGLCAATESALGPDVQEQRLLDGQLAVVLSEMRLIKDAYEVKALQSSITASKRGFEDVIARLKTSRSERELEGVFWTRARMEGNDVGYTSIVASGAHACTLHWKKNDGVIRDGDLLLLDAGIEGRSLYSADITRTLPISGRFTREQRAV